MGMSLPGSSYLLRRQTGDQVVGGHPKHAAERHELAIGHGSESRFDLRDRLPADLPTGDLALRGEFILRELQRIASAPDRWAAKIQGLGHGRLSRICAVRMFA